ncbi:MAG: phosphoribosylanthranilate isomerase [Treponema sp.]|jgi:phosphoribosylanthranilate isomerase|nr:phosphoribosylanthranilate isomerase [Treponema sp.]
MKIKICGLFREADIDYVNEAAPDYIGFVFVRESRRYVAPEKAAALRKRLREGIVPVGVFVRAGPEDIAALYREGIISVVQLHGGEDDAYIAKLRKLCTDPLRAGTLSPFPLIRAVDAGALGVKTAGAAVVTTAAEACGFSAEPDGIAAGADYLLIDNGKGGTGKSFDWSLLDSFPQAAVSARVFLAGGLGLHNIGEAARRRPYAIDVSSGAETDGVKDREKIVSLVKYVRPA